MVLTSGGGGPKLEYLEKMHLSNLLITNYLMCQSRKSNWVPLCERPKRWPLSCPGIQKLHRCVKLDIFWLFTSFSGTRMFKMSVMQSTTQCKTFSLDCNHVAVVWCEHCYWVFELICCISTNKFNPLKKEDTSTKYNANIHLEMYLLVYW